MKIYKVDELEMPIIIIQVNKTLGVFISKQFISKMVLQIAQNLQFLITAMMYFGIPLKSPGVFTQFPLLIELQ